MRKRTLIYGIGINDASYPILTCPMHRAWAAMFYRCYSKKFHSVCQTYIGCTVVPEWHSFMAFRAWMIAKDYEGKHLDKDILFPGNKVYSPETCVFVPSQLNAFVLDRAALRGKWPIGVYWHNRDNKFISRCGNPFNGKQETIGYFDDPAKAHEAWKAKKH